jgi:tetraacyldisaccharide 4'-kinase
MATSPEPIPSLISLHPSPAARVAASALNASARLYAGLLRLRQRLYRAGCFKTLSLKCKVISIGNITLGGAGKTPTTIYVANFLKHSGFRVAVLSRGYRGTKEREGGLVSDGNRIFMKPGDAGDEPCLIARRCPGVPVLVGKNRFETGRFAVLNFSAQVLILDDAFQHLALKRDINLVLLDASSPIGNGKLFPAGPLREPPTALGRGDIFVLTRCTRDDDPVSEEIAPFLRGKPVFRCRHVPDRLIFRDAAGKESFCDTGYLAGRRILAFSGIARNSDFFSMLDSLNYRIAARRQYPDHYRYASRDLDPLARIAESAGAEAMITTEKDYEKLSGTVAGGLPIFALGIRVCFGKFETGFKNVLKRAIRNDFKGKT